MEALTKIKNHLVNWINEDQDKCDGCGKPLQSVFDAFYHKRECVAKPLGYTLRDENDIFSASSRAWFFKELQKRRG